MSPHIEGYEVPIHRSIVDPIMLAGLPRTVCFLLWTVTAALAFGLRQIWVVPGTLVIHLVLAYATKNDPFFFEIFVKALKAPKRLLP